MSLKRLYIANWKMYWTGEETLRFVAQHYDVLYAVAKRVETNATLVLCPSYTALYPLAQMLKDTSVYLGAQDCSEYTPGAVTGQISARDLRQIGCCYCIIGHSEQRRFGGLSDVLIARKLGQLLDNDISPIVCIGESEREYKEGKTLAVLNQQLIHINAFLQKRETMSEGVSVIVAYEPVWAIGSGLVPSHEHLETVFAWLSKVMNILPHSIRWLLVYGGSVTSGSIGQLKTMNLIQGFLIGGASLDFQEFEKIVKCN